MNGRTQPGYTDRPLVEVRGNPGAYVYYGLQFNAPSNVVSALCVNSFLRANLYYQASSWNVVEGCFLGPDLSGTNAPRNRVSLWFEGGANNRVGGINSGARNLISTGNSDSGQGIYLAGGTNVTILGNYIGTDWSGTQCLSNASTPF